MATAQAFGVREGALVSEYGGRRSIGSTNPFYFKIDVPQPNREFESYSAFATPQTGICKVSGLGITHENDSYGTASKSAFSGLKQALIARYGRSRDFDFLKSGALWDEPHEWAWSIYKDERTLTSFWTRQDGASLPRSIESIMLDTKAVSSSGPYLTLTYEFANFKQCLAIMEQRQNEGL
jgi:hypothetical protein